MTDIPALARSLADNEAFQKALDNTKAGALEALSTIDADDKNGIIRQQAIVAVVDSIRADLEAFIRSGQPKPQRAIP